MPTESYEEKERRYIQATRRKKELSEGSLKRALKDKERLDRYAEEFGVEPAPDPEPGFLYKLTDALDYPRQNVAGLIAKTVGAKGFEDLDYSEAAAKAADEDLRTADLLRDAPFFKDHDVIRGAAGFLGDVFTDPLTYIAPFGGIGKRVGTLPVSGKAVKTIAGEETAEQIVRRIQSSAVAKRVAEFGDDIPLSLREAIVAEEATKASAPFKELSLLNAYVREKAPKEAAVVGKEFLEQQIERKARQIAEHAGISLQDGTPTIDVLNQLVKKPSFKLSGPLAGSEMFGRIPLIGSDEVDIPIITKLSEKFYDKLTKGYYAKPVEIRTYVSDALKKNPESVAWRAADYIGQKLADLGTAGVKAASLLSLRVKASGSLFGSSAPKSIIQETARADGALATLAGEEAKYIFRDIINEPEADSILKTISEKLQEFPESRIGERPEVAFNELRHMYNKVRPGLGDRVANAASEVYTTFDRLREIEQENHILGDRVLKGYVHQMHNPTLGESLPDNPAFQQIQSWFSGENAVDFSAKRTFENMKKAELHGYNPEKNVLAALAARLYSHKKAMMEKEFGERFAYQWAITKPSYDKLTKLAFDASDQIRATQAIRAAQGLDVEISPQQGLAANGLKYTTKGQPLRMDLYDRLEKAMQSPSRVTDPNFDDALEEVRHMGLKFTPEERTLVALADDNLQKQVQIIPGRAGESTFARAGGTRLSEMSRKQLKNLSEEDKIFWDGVLPSSFVDAYKDQVLGYHTLKAMEKGLEEGNPAKSGVRTLLNLYQHHHKWMKIGATLAWPAYWARNLGSAFFQPMEAASTLGDALNPIKMIRNYRIIQGKADAMTRTGELLTSKQLFYEMSRHGINASASTLADFLPSYANEYKRLLMSDVLGKNVPTIGDALKREAPGARLKNAIMNRQPLEAAKAGVQGGLEFAQKLEAYGRQHAYLNFRINGHDPSSAAELTNRLMIDYAKGKTPFERKFLNNIFFFYAFSRGNASNMFHAMMARPGALTAQLHAHKGIAEMLTDPESYVPYPDAEKTARTYRSNQQLSTYLGVNPETGLPRLLTGTGLPVEDLGKWGGVIPDIRKATSWNEALLQGGDAASKAAQTVFAQLNPPLRGVFENLVFKRNFYFNRPITDETLRKIPAWERDLPKIAGYHFDAVPESYYEALDEATKKVLGGRKNPDGTITINPYAMAVLTTLVPYVGRFLSTRSALTKPGIPSHEKFARLLSGIHVDEVDPDTAIGFDMSRNAREYYEARGIPTTRKALKFSQSFPDDEE